MTTSLSFVSGVHACGPYYSAASGVVAGLPHLSPGDSQTMDWYQRSACSLLGFHFLKRIGVNFSLVAINEETLTLDDLVEKKVHMEIPVGKGIPTSRALILIKWVIFKGRFH